MDKYVRSQNWNSLLEWHNASHVVHIISKILICIELSQNETKKG